MSRLKNFSRNLATSYLQLGVNVIYSLVSVPLILHWMPKTEFGIWVVLVQLMGYITLVDLGVNQAIARFLVDHKDRRGESQYGALVKTSALVSAVQGLLVLLVVTLASPLLAEFMKIQVEYQATFVSLLRLQGIITAFMFCMNPLAIMLNAHQRADVVSFQGMFSLMASLGLLWFFLAGGRGIYSFVYANALTACIAPWYLLWNCWRLGFLPRAGEWGKVSWHQFKEVFLYGKDVFFMNVGAQLITASQAIIISRTLGLDAAAAWSVGTRIFMLVRQILFQPYSAAVAGMCEMAVRNELGQLRTRFQNLVVLTASLGILTGVSFALCNSLFVEVWTSGKILWSPWNDLWLAIWLYASSLQCTHCNFVLVTKNIGGMRYLYFVEGCCFVALSLTLGYQWGLTGIIGCSIVCTTVFSCLFGLWRSSHYFHVDFWVVAFEWVRPSLKLAAASVPMAFILWFITNGLSPIWRLAIHGIAAVLIGGILFLRLGLPSEMIRETGARLPRPAARLLGMLVPV